MAIKLSIFMVPTGRTALKTDSWFLWTSVCTLSPGWKWTGITLVITLFLDTNRGDFTESLIWSEQNETSTKWWITTKHDRAIIVPFHKHRYNQTICDWFYRCCNKCVFLVSGLRAIRCMRKRGRKKTRNTMILFLSHLHTVPLSHIKGLH